MMLEEKAVQLWVKSAETFVSHLSSFEGRSTHIFKSQSVVSVISGPGDCKRSNRKPAFQTVGVGLKDVARSRSSTYRKVSGSIPCCSSLHVEVSLAKYWRPKLLPKALPSVLVCVCVCVCVFVMGRLALCIDAPAISVWMLTCSIKRFEHSKD